MVLWMKYQLHKHKDMSLDSYHLPKSYALTEGIERAWVSPDFARQPVYLQQQASNLKKSLSQNQAERNRGKYSPSC